MDTNRDLAVRYAITIIRKLFEWTHIPWSPQWAEVVARMVDHTIAAAADEIERRRDDHLLETLQDTPPPARPASSHPASARTTRLDARDYTSDDVRRDDPNYARFAQQANAPEQARSLLRREAPRGGRR